MPRLDTALQTWQRNSLPGSRLVNMYAREAPGSPQGVVLEPHGGLKNWLVTGLGSGPIRGMFYQPGALNSHLFVVSGETVYRVDRELNATSIGTLTPGTSPVRMAADDNQLVVVTDPEAWIVTWNGVTRITDSDLPAVRDVLYLNTYFIFIKRDDDEIVYALADPSTIGALDFATAEDRADNLVGGVKIGSNAHLIGTDTIETWTTSGNAAAPVVRRPGAVNNFGCGSTYSIQTINNQAFWVGRDRRVYTNPAQPAPISNGELDEKLNELSEDDLWSVNAWTHTYQGESFYVLDIPGKGTWSFSLSARVWGQRASWEQTLYRPQCCVQAFGKWLAGDRTSGKIYEIDRDTYTDAGGVMERVCTTSILTERQGVRADAIYLECTTGEGITSGQGSEPKVMFRKSTNRGLDYTNEISRDLGVGGDYERRVVVRRQGRFDAPGMICEWRVTDPVYWAVMGARLDGY